jgi:hypothetical protein
MNMSAVCVGAGAAPIDEVAVGRVVGQDCSCCNTMKEINSFN